MNLIKGAPAVCCILAMLILVFCWLWLLSLKEANSLRSDVRFARDIIARINMERDLALKSNASQAALSLRHIMAPAGMAPFQNVASDIVDEERNRAIRDIIAYLRVKTGKDLGDDPNAWYNAYK